MSIRVAVVEDERTMRENLARLLDSAAGFSCVGALPDAERALAKLPASAPDVVLMDLHLPGRSGADCVRGLKQLLPGAQFIMLTIEEDSELVFESIEAGASGYLVKNVELEKILDAIRDVHDGGSPISSHIARMLVRRFQRPMKGPAPLTARESEVIGLLARGYRSKEVADELGISVPTVNTHVRNVYEKLHVRSRAEAVARYIAG